MGTSHQQPVGRSVKGLLLLDFCYLIKSTPQLPWKEHLSPEDLDTVTRLIVPGSWYQFELSDRLARAVFKVVARENFDILRNIGRLMVEKMLKESPNLVSPGRPLETLRKQGALEERLYSFPAFRYEDGGPRCKIIRAFSLPDRTAARITIEVLSGIMEKLIELSGGRNVRIAVTGWAGDGGDYNTIEVTWDE